MFLFKLKSLATKPLLDKKMYQIVNPEAEVAGNIPANTKDIFIKDCYLLFRRMNIPLVKELGSGVFSTTYESFFAGKRVCVKITKDRGDAESYLKMKEVLPLLKEDRSFFPRVFTVKQFLPEEVPGLSQIYFVMITELLVPISPVVYQNLFDPMESTTVLNKINLKDIISFFDSHFDITLVECKNAIETNKEFFCKELLQLIKNKDFESRIAIRELAEKIMLKSPNQIPAENLSYLISHLVLSIRDLLREFRIEFFPETETLMPVLEEKQQLFDAIKSVESRFGIIVHDLHRGNIMMRPNGQLVFCDLGGYL